MLTKVFATIVAFVVLFTPSWLYLASKIFFQPKGSWQEFIFQGSGIYFLGVIQIILMLCFMGLFCVIWTDQRPQHRARII